MKAMFVGTLVALLGQFSLVQAQQAPASPNKKDAVLIHLTQKRVVASAQGEKLEDATSVKPGDVIEYRAAYTNISNQTVKGLVAKLPVPQGLEYLPKSAKPFNSALQMASADGQFAVEPLRRKLADGSTQTLPYNEYRTLRWNIGQLNAGASVVVSVRAKVESATSNLPATTPAISPPSKVVETSRP
jgi:uncharacterized repeat protein (TIGR01451 family)